MAEKDPRIAEAMRLLEEVHEEVRAKARRKRTSWRNIKYPADDPRISEAWRLLEEVVDEGPVL